MDKQQAQHLIKTTFEQPFDKAQFTLFLKNLCRRIADAPFTYQGQYIPDAYKPYISMLERIGKFSAGEQHLDLLIIRLKKETSLERARTMQRNFVAWYLNGSRGGELKDAALAAFVAPDDVDWRFSLVKMDYKFAQTPTGKLKVKEEFTPARRWSFLVGVNERSHTAQSRLLPILLDDEHPPTLADLEHAFDIETVTKEFFLKYRDLFIRVKEALDDVVRRDARVLADFAAKGVNTVDFAKKLMGQIVFLYFLQKKGWFGVPRDHVWGGGSTAFLRELFEKKHSDYVNFFNDLLEPLFYEALRLDRSHDDDYYAHLKCRIPFLNGGLFDPISNYDWVHTDLLLPDALFSNMNMTKEGDIGDGMLDMFDRYNFTVKEDEPLEKEVAVDPEMLGKVFENLLEVNDRKSKGTYYTPREIVYYMCQQSLLNYLATTLDSVVSRDDLEKLMYYGEQVSEHEARVIAKGKETETYSYKLPERIRKYAALIDETLAHIKVCDPAIGSGAFPVGMMAEIVRMRQALSSYLDDSERIPYNFKRDCIQHALYGVDIDASAVEIAKLRLWLSLIVDEEDITKIKPLPNLDYKIVCGNALIGIEKNLFNHRAFAELELLKHQLFDETKPKKKLEYAAMIEKLITEIINGHKEFDFRVYFSEVFHEKDGFDVIIGNPPYGAKLSADEKTLLYQRFKHQDYQLDSYLLFVEKAFELAKHQGVISFIIPNPWLTNLKLKKIRKFIVNEHTVLNITHYHKSVFEATVDTEVVFFSKQPSRQHDVKIVVHEKGDRILTRFVAQDKWKRLNGEPINIFVDEKTERIVSKLQQNSAVLSSICNVVVGMKPYQTGKGHPKQTKKIVENRIFDASSKIDNTYKPLLRGKDIEKYVTKWDGTRWIKYGDHLAEPRYSANFEADEKVVIRQTGDCLIATLDTKRFVCMNNMHVITQKNQEFALKYILAVINSILLNFYYQTLNPEKGEALAEVKKENVGKLLIKNIPLSEQQPFITLVDHILAAKQRDPAADTRALEAELDRLVYGLYGLTAEEIVIVEGKV